ncbi:MAG: delta-60 repeat domain-containing protein, partial [Bacteroidota bacterium]
NTFDNTLNQTINRDVNTISIQSDGKLIVGGSFMTCSYNYLCRLNTDGTFDNTFNTGTGFDGSVSTTAIQSDGKILVSGFFNNYNGNSRKYILRLNTDGSLD